MEDKEELPKDLFGQIINPGDFVVGGQSNAIAVYRVMKLTPKMVRIVSVTASSPWAKKGKLRYANELLKIEEQLVTFYLMTH